jgi:hypothetical protein
MSLSPLATAVFVTHCVLACGFAVAAEDGVRKDQSGGAIVVPPSSIPRPGDAGKSGHTNVQIYRPPPAQPQSPVSPPGSPGKTLCSPGKKTPCSPGKKSK